MSDRAQSQKKLAALLGVGVVGAIGALYFALESGSSSARSTTRPTIVETEVLEGVRSSADPEALWVQRSENRMRELEQQLNLVTKTNEALQAQVEANVKDERRIANEVSASVNQVIVKLAAEVKAADNRAVAAEAESVRLASVVENIQAELEKVAARPTADPGSTVLSNPTADVAARPETVSFSPGQGQNEFVIANGQAQGQPRNLNAEDRSAPGVTETAPMVAAVTPASVEFSLSGEKDKRQTISGYLPAGSYAPAVVLSGVDASVGVQQASDPRPVLLRLTGPAITAASGDGAGQEIDVTGCILTAEAVGDLSSERVFPRLISMTCSPEDGVISETQVAGFVAGQGKAGVRGKVVSREGDLVTNAFIAGGLGGLAGVVSDIGSTASGDVTSDDALQGLDTILGRGVLDAGGQGAGQAFDRLAQYYIDRAEQYQAVISLYGGTQVEVVFLKGVRIDG